MKAWLRSALDLVLPRCCGVCGMAVAFEDRHLCWECRSSLLLVHEPFCSLCGHPVFGVVDYAYVCHQCGERNPQFDGARAVARYEGVVREMIHALKYRRALWLVDDMVTLLRGGAGILFHPEQIDFICAVPLYPRRQRERGFNQADLLARGLARQIDCTYQHKALRRLRATDSQTRLSARARQANVRGAFGLGPRCRVADKHVLLVDDVMTTGSTVSECARALKEGGAASVHVLTLARG